MGSELRCQCCSHLFKLHKEQDRRKPLLDEIRTRRCRDCRRCRDDNDRDVLDAARHVVDGAPIGDRQPEAAPA